MTEFFNVTLRFPIRSLYAVIVNFFGQSVGTLEKISLSILKELQREKIPQQVFGFGDKALALNLKTSSSVTVSTAQ